MDAKTHCVAAGSRRSRKVRSAEFAESLTWILQNSISTMLPTPTGAVVRRSHQESRSNQCTGSSVTTQSRPSCLTARGRPVGLNRTSTRALRVVSFAVAVTVYALS
uniref:Uncharacterized protein n=1 Tax=Arthrobacter sp. Chr15 TaxID=447032 RepID=A6YFQ0_9MICC|nr:unknown [Arthrobacter sp. Chr15]